MYIYCHNCSTDQRPHNSGISTSTVAQFCCPCHATALSKYGIYQPTVPTNCRHNRCWRYTHRFILIAPLELAVKYIHAGYLSSIQLLAVALFPNPPPQYLILFGHHSDKTQSPNRDLQYIYTTIYLLLPSSIQILPTQIPLVIAPFHALTLLCSLRHLQDNLVHGHVPALPCGNRGSSRSHRVLWK